MSFYCRKGSLLSGIVTLFATADAQLRNIFPDILGSRVVTFYDVLTKE
jgi:DNA-binding ferritin-like protein (Dps family)